MKYDRMLSNCALFVTTRVEIEIILKTSTLRGQNQNEITFALIGDIDIKKSNQLQAKKRSWQRKIIK